MKKKIAISILLVVFVLVTVGCAQRLLDFTIISSKNVDLSQAANFRVQLPRTSGKHVVHIIFTIPTGTPNMKEALDRAIESVPGAVALVDGVISFNYWSIFGIYGQSYYIVEGTALVNPKFLSSKYNGKYLIGELNKDGDIRKIESVDKAKFEKTKSKLLDSEQI